MPMAGRGAKYSWREAGSLQRNFMAFLKETLRRKDYTNDLF